MKLVIVESPTKAKTISKFLGKGFSVESSYGHLRDLPKSRLGIDVEKDFEPHYIVPKKVQSRATALKKTASKAKEVIIATDEDREGEAIAWHITKILGAKDPEQLRRIVFHEITKEAIQAALEHPRSIDLRLVDAQQARRILDRLVGYKLSPFLWKKIGRGLSAGRVQSVALRLVAEREEEIQNFKPEEFWTITAKLLRKSGGESIEAALHKIDGETVAKLGVKTGEEARRITGDLEKASFQVTKVERREIRKNPLPPFITSTLQQSSAQRLGFSSKKTMFLAQSLYESGHITYMRTDSLNLSEEALRAAKEWVEEHLKKPYASDAPRRFKTKSRLAQEAHEAIRPTRADAQPKDVELEKDQQKLYDLIWRRFIASQLPQAVFDSTTVEISAQGTSRSYAFRASGNILKFDGFTNIWKTKFEDRELPQCAEGDALTLETLLPEQHFTEPPPRYNEASLIKTLEKYGIGRPSTYAPIISVIQERNYVEKQQGRLHPTEIGTLVNRVLTENFPELLNVSFTAKMEEDLDEVAEGKERWQSVVGEFYHPFSKLLEKKYEEVKRSDFIDEKTDISCEKCGKMMLVKFGRFGKFLACSGYPECKTTKTLKDPPKSTGLPCPKCGTGEIIERRVSKKGRARGKIFWGCNRYPQCDYASWENPLKEKTE